MVAEEIRKLSINSTTFSGDIRQITNDLMDATKAAMNKAEVGMGAMVPGTTAHGANEPGTTTRANEPGTTTHYHDS